MGASGGLWAALTLEAPFCQGLVWLRPAIPSVGRGDRASVWAWWLRVPQNQPLEPRRQPLRSACSPGGKSLRTRVGVCAERQSGLEQADGAGGEQPPARRRH